jgi:hypothetical protein
MAAIGKTFSANVTEAFQGQTIKSRGGYLILPGFLFSPPAKS